MGRDKDADYYNKLGQDIAYIYSRRDCFNYFQERYFKNRLHHQFNNFHDEPTLENIKAIYNCALESTIKKYK